MTTLAQVLDQAIRHHQTGNFFQAEQLYRQILQSDPNHVDALHLLGLIAQQFGQLDQAHDLIVQALRYRPDFAEARNNLGNVYRQQGKLDDAIACYRHTLALKPEYAKAHNNLGTCLQEKGNFVEAITSLEQALRLMPNSAEAHFNLGLTLRKLNRLDPAVAHIQRAIQLKPDFAAAYCELGLALREMKQTEQAIDCYRQAILHKRDFPEAFNNLGNILQDQEKSEEAVACLRQAIQLKPDYVEAFYNLGIVLRAQGKVEEAMDCYQRALDLQPDHAPALNNAGNLLQEQGKHDEAATRFQQAGKAKPAHAEAHFNLGMLKLLKGEFEEGWLGYERRRDINDLGRVPESTWDGSPLAGRRILLAAEQGLGDTLQFVRYAQMLQRLGGRVIVMAQAPLLKLLARCEGIDQLVSQEMPAPPCDVQTSMLSVPRLCQSTLASMPAEVPYIYVDRERVETWRARLAEFPGFRVGICWQGSQGHKNDRRRSVALSQFAPLAQIPGIRLISLQRGPGVEQLESSSLQPAPINLPGRADDPAEAWLDTAAIIQNLDLVISVDTAVAHLAGAMGKRVWIALPFAHDWRWLLDREDSPWYPSARLFRQPRLGDWRAVFELMTLELLSGVDAR